MKPSLGRIVHYTLTEQDAQAINRRRDDASKNVRPMLEVADGKQVHVGNHVEAGQVYPLVITRIWNEHSTGVNGQGLLDGNDTFWATSRTEGDGEGHWAWPPRV